MKYPDTVAKARLEARESDEPQVVYEYRVKGKIKYGFSTQKEFRFTLVAGRLPMIRLLLCMPDGRVVQ